MSVALTPAGSSLGGAAVLMACACGVASNSAKLAAFAGVGASTKIIHPLFLGIAAALIISGLWRVARSSAHLAIGAFVIFGLAAVLTPPMAMSKAAYPWNATQMGGGALYLAAASLLGYAFWRAFPSARPGAAGAAIGGAALATGCTCCMVTGAVAGMAVTGGASVAYFNSMPLLFWLGLTVVAAGLFRLGGWQAAAFVPLGGLIIKYAPKGLALTGDWLVAGANLRSYASYALTLAGTGLIMYGFAVAYRRARAGSRSYERRWTPATAEPMVHGSGD